MAGSLSMPSTAATLANVAVVDFGDTDRCAVHSRYNNGPRTLHGVIPHCLRTVMCT
jgi:hypothetical protein